MPLESTELVALRDELVRARAKGVRALQLGAERVEYRTDAEMADAIADLDRRIASASKSTPRVARFSSSKGM